MTLTGVMTVILRYFTELGNFCNQLCQSGRRSTHTVSDEAV